MSVTEKLAAIAVARDGGDFDAAVSLCQQGLDEFPGDPDMLFDLGGLLLAQYRQGVQDGTLSEAFNLPLAFGELDFPATVSVAASLKTEALRTLEHCISKGTDHVDAAALLGLALIDCEETFGEAIGLLHRASAVDPGHQSIQYGLGILGLVQGQCAGAHAAFSNALAADPAMPGAEIMQRVTAYAMAPTGAMTEAFADLEHDDYLIIAPILRMALGNTNLPDDIQTSYDNLASHTATQLAAAAVRMLDGDDVASTAMSIGGRCLSQANQLVGGLTDVTIGAGLILFKTVNFELAVMAFESVVAADPDNEIGNRMLERSRRP